MIGVNGPASFLVAVLGASVFLREPDIVRRSSDELPDGALGAFPIETAMSDPRATRSDFGNQIAVGAPVADVVT
ncbi:MAG: hypothetical protein D6723_01590 [Acidobacteria bacterium]|nr:MAG: hypothetical protein D6723_01590 [Acidobacteriota bacterium]